MKTAPRLPAPVLPGSVLLGLTLAVLMVSLPHAAHLPAWASAVTALALAWRAFISWRVMPLPSRWLRIVITLGVIAGVLARYHTLFGQEAGVTLLVLLTALKLLETRTTRDGIVVIFLSCFIIVTNFFYSQTIPTALYMLLTLLVIVSAWLHLQSPTLGRQPRRRIALLLLAQSLPLMLVMVSLFPRVQGPLWGLPHGDLSQTGLTDTMSPGSLSRLSLSNDIAFRVTFKGTAPLHEQMYWRGPVLSAFDGRNWTIGHGRADHPPQLADTGNAVEYSVLMEPNYKRWLFALEMPAAISTESRLGEDFQLRRREPVTSRIQYDARSYLGYRANVKEDPFVLRYDLQLPSGIDPRSRALAQRWRKKYGSNDNTIMLAALDYFHRQGFVYTLQPPPLPGSNEIDDFMFETRKGFCEHYASAFVFLMRAAGIPARVVTGYQGGQLNDLGGYYIVRQSDAHAWAEVWLSGRGWVRADPTAAVSPERLEDGLDASVQGDDARSALDRAPPHWLLQLRFNLDRIAYQWDQWVLGYDSERQFALLRKLGLSSLGWRSLGLYLVAGMALLIGLFALLMLRGLYGGRVDAAQRQYLKFCRKLARAGATRAPFEGPRDFAARAARLLPAQAAAIEGITARYLRLRYGREAPSGELQALRRSIGAFKL